jgi:uncharacterized Tic20 family protein
MSDQDTPPPFDENPSAQDAAVPGVAKLSPPPPSAGVVPGLGRMPESEEKTMALLAHLLGAVTNVLGPLVIWLIKKDESPFVNDQGKEALNFQLTILIGYIMAGFLSVVPVVQCFSVLFIPALAVVGLVFGILGCLEANNGVAYRYPFAIRLIK